MQERVLTLGIAFDKSSDAVTFTRGRVEADARLKHFFSQIVGGDINTRANRDDMISWISKASTATGSGTSSGGGGNRPGGGTSGGGSGGKSSGSGGGGTGKNSGGTGRPTPPKFENLPFSADIEKELASLANQKLMVLYHELCTTPLTSVQLLSVGWWSFLTTLCSVAQGTPSNDFGSFLGHDRLMKIGFGVKDDRKNLINSLTSIANAGNTTKHATSATMLNQAQLYNDVQSIDRVVVRLLEVLNGSYTPSGKWP